MFAVCAFIALIIPHLEKVNYSENFNMFDIFSKHTQLEIIYPNFSHILFHERNDYPV